ncbi:autotransporter-associated beta strand repeat-containing protein, partial [Bradyrhizobium sp. 24]|nr:autotransporter-associated beta strand repeat-containing protein [Bradyrhizobium sp. 24]
VAQSGVALGTFAGGAGTLNINSGGTLETNTLARVAVGTGQVNFDNAILRARINTAFFIGGFSAGTLNIATGGLTVDTQAFTVSASSGFSGVGGLTKTGTGTFNLRAANTYTGATVIQAGTLALASSGSVAASSRVVANGTFSISGITAA